MFARLLSKKLIAVLASILALFVAVISGLGVLVWPITLIIIAYLLGQGLTDIIRNYRPFMTPKPIINRKLEPGEVIFPK